MATVTVTINDKEYAISCDDGQEDHLISLAQELNARVTQLNKQMRGRVQENLLLVLGGLMFADELTDMKREISDLREEISHTSQSFESGKQVEMEMMVGKTIDEIAARIDRLADRLEVA